MNLPKMNNCKVLCFGELLYRLQSSTNQFFDLTSASVFACPGGSEANVAVTLAELNIDSSYLTVIPRNSLTKEIVEDLEERGVDISNIVFEGDRLGSYILLSANGLTNGEVVYDRNYSSFASMKIDTIDWEKVFENVGWFHWTALTPALNENMIAICQKALEVAESKGIFISVDLNYRSKLWQYGISPVEVLPQLVLSCDLIMGNIWASNRMLGTSIDDAWSQHRDGLDYFPIAGQVAQEVFELYPKCKYLANTFRFMDSARHNLFYATFHDRNMDYISKSFETNELIDRIGSGDAFMGGLIAGVVNGYEPQKLIDFATEIGFKKLFVKGDFIRL